VICEAAGQGWVEKEAASGQQREGPVLRGSDRLEACVRLEQEAEEFKLSIFDESRTMTANASSSSGGGAGAEDSGLVQTIVFDQPQGLLPLSWCYG
jgi:hypothetical protein